MVALPAALKPGGTIGIIAPASSAPRKTTARGIKYLSDRGYRIKTSLHLTRGKFYLAGKDAERLHWLETFLIDPAIDALICVRGGYGVLRIIDRLSYRKLKRVKPKILVGYSDITSLQMALLCKLGWVTYSGPMVASDMGKVFSPFSEEWFWKVISEHPYPLELLPPDNEPLQVFRRGAAEGTLIGGCLSLITPILGSAYMPAVKGGILLIEDIGEKTYRLDKQLHILRLRGVLDKISGLLVGKFINCFPKNPERSFTLKDYLQELLEDYDFPVITNVPYGHIARRWTIPWGTRVRIETSPPKITILSDR